MSKLQQIKQAFEAFQDKARRLESRVVTDLFYSPPGWYLKLFGNVLIVVALLNAAVSAGELLAGNFLSSGICVSTAVAYLLLGAILRDWARIKKIIGEPTKNPFDVDLHGKN